MRKLVFFILVLFLAANAQEIGAKYLIISYDNFVNDIQPLAEWKHKKGMRTKVVTLSQIGSSSAQIKNYIQTAYNTWTIPPEFVLLVGSPNLIPWGQSSPYSDHFYMNMNADIYNEILLGRLTVHNTTEAQTVINKILLYERTPNMDDSTWLRNACLIVGEDGSTYPPLPGTDDYIYWGDSRHAYGLMLANGYNRIDTLSTLLGNNANDVIQSVNNGVGFVQYRGQGVNNWWGGFGVNPDNTNNGSMLPIVLSITCSTIGTGSSPAVAERWLLTGTPTTPRGGSGYFATTTVRSHVANIRSAASRGFFTAVFTDRKRTFGEACEGGRLNIYNLYSDALDYQGFATLGDPEMNIWTATPKAIDVAHDPSIGVDDTLAVTVTSYGTAVESALVCIVLDTTVYEYGYTDFDGQISFQPTNLHPGQMDITVTGRNLYPYEATIQIVEDNPYMSYQSHTVIDTLDNGNGIPESGETILLNMTLRNIGLVPANGVVATLRANDTQISIIDSLGYYDNVAPQDSACSMNPYVFTISPTCPDNHIINFEVEIVDASENTWYGEFMVEITNVRGIPTGPDQYGYYIYDNSDSLYGHAPSFEWFEIAPPGPGTVINWATNPDADTIRIALPDTFWYYDMPYDSIGVCSNGFLELDHPTYRFGDNDSIPKSNTPSDTNPVRLVAPFWDDLDPRPSSGSGDVYYYNDIANHRLIVEYHSIAHYADPLHRETFQVQLRDPQYYPTPTGDGEILFLYDTVSIATSNTIGIEDHTEQIGIQYLYDGSYEAHAATITDGRALLITTKVPTLPASFPWLHTVYYTFDDSIGGNNNGILEPNETVEIYASVQNNGDTTAHSVTGILRTSNPDANVIDSTASYGEIPIGAIGNNSSSPYTVHISANPSDTAVGFALQLTCNSGTYQKTDYFTFYIYGSPGVEENKISTPGAFSLNVEPNPFFQRTSIRYLLPATSNEKTALKIFDITGRLVKDFSEQLSGIGHPSSVWWDGTDDSARRVAQGVYFIHLQTAGSQRVIKTVLLR